MAHVTFRARMRLGAALLLTLAALLHAVPAAASAADAGLTVQALWQAPQGSGIWTPYRLTVSNSGGSAFDGQIRMQPSGGIGTRLPQTGEAAVTAPVQVAPGAEKQLTVFAPAPMNMPAYEVDLLDTGGRVVDSQVVTSQALSTWVGVLSDGGTAAAGAVSQATVGSIGGSGGLQAYAFQGPGDLPASAVYLRGLAAIVIDQFDTAALSKEQVRVLQDYVATGGALIVAGGADWRRTFAGLPSTLVPLAPAGTRTAPLDGLLALFDESTDATTSVAVGTLAPGAAAPIRSSTGVPLIAESKLGAGWVVELTFDPDADGVPPAVRSQAWGQAVGRSGLPGSANQCFKCIGGVPGGAVISGLGCPGCFGRSSSLVGYAGLIQQVLLATGKAALPSALLLAALLLVYLAVAGPAMYLVLKRLGRRELAWVTVPVLAVLVTTSTYAFGIGRAGTVYDNQLRFGLVLPGGDVDVTAFHGIFAPRRGDYHVQLGAGQLVSSLPAMYYGGANTGVTPEIRWGAEPEAVLTDAPVWSETTIRSEGVEHLRVQVDARVSYANGELSGTVRNLGQVTLLNPIITLPDGRHSSIGGSLAPGATARFDTATLSQQFGGLPTGYGNFQPATTFGGAITVVPNLPSNLTLSAEQRVSYLESMAPVIAAYNGPLFIAAYDGPKGVQVDSSLSDGSTTAVLVQPVTWQSVQDPPGSWLQPRRVATAAGDLAGERIDVFEFDLPPGVLTPLLLSVNGGPMQPPMVCNGNSCTGSAAPAVAQPVVPSFDVYDSAAGGWQSIVAGARLQPGDFAGGRVLIRVDAADSTFQYPSLAPA